MEANKKPVTSDLGGEAALKGIQTHSERFEMSAKNFTYRALCADKGNKRKGERLVRLQKDSCRLPELTLDQKIQLFFLEINM